MKSGVQGMHGLRVLGVVLGSAAVMALMAGCSLQGTAALTNGPVAGTALKGGVMGGQQPIYNSAIGLWAAGVTTPTGTNTPGSVYGTGATNLLATAGITTDSGGSFTIPAHSYTCPSPTTQMYLTASGGDPSGAASTSNNNSAAVLVGALGACQNLSSVTTLQINELTTVAAAFALGQFFGGFGSAMTGTSSTTGDLIGTSNTNANGLTNAFATAHNLVSVTTGAVAPLAAASGTNYFLTQFDQEKVVTIANILGACINQTSATATGNCTTLFADATPTSGTAPTDTFQAAVYMSLNPTSVNGNTPGTGQTVSQTNMSALFGLQSSTPAFGGGLSVTPNDWTLSIQYSGTGITFISSAAVDPVGDIWFSNATTTNGSSGAVLLNGGTGTHGGTAGVTGADLGFFTGYTTTGTTPTTYQANGTRQVAVDQTGNAWFPGYNTQTANSVIFEASPSTLATTAAYTFSTAVGNGYGIAIDPANNVFASTSSANVVSVTNGQTSTAASTTSVAVTGASITITPSSVAYIPQNGGSTIYDFLTNVSVTAPTANTNFAGGANDYGSAVDANNLIWVANHGGSYLYHFPSSTGTTAPAVTSVNSSCLSSPAYIAVDGANNIWTANTAGQNEYINVPSSGTASSVALVCEFNGSTGALISSGSQSLGYGPHNIIAGYGRAIAIDLSGNVWVGSYTNSTTATNTVAEIVGAAVPTVAPISLAIKNKTVGTRP